MKNKEKIYLDLSKLSGEERLLTPKIIDSQDIFLKDFINDGNFTDYYDLHFGKYGWTISKNLEDSEKQEITFSEFRQLFSEGEEVLQVENNGWIKIESEKDLPKKGTDCHVFFKTGVQTIFNNIDDLEILTLLNRCSYYMPIIKPLPPKF